MPVSRDLSALSDEQLAAQAATGSGDHFAELVRRHMAGIYRVGYLLTGNRQEAEDVAQETFIKVYRSISRYRPDLPFKPWLYRIGINTTRSAARKRRSRPTTASLDENEAWVSASADSAMADSVAGNADAVAILKMLPPDYRQVVILRAIEGLGFLEIAEILDIPEPTARTKFHRAKGLLKGRLEADGDNGLGDG